jgi:hypothetical protein
MGDTRLKNIGPSSFNWCAKLEGLGHANCGAALGVQGSADRGLSASLLSLQVAGVDLDAIDGLRQVQLKDVTFPAVGEATLPAILLTSFDLYSSSIGSVLIKDVANNGTVFDCAKIDCSASSTKNIWNASQAGAIRADATIGKLGGATGDLTLQEAVLGTFGTDSFNPLDVPASKLALLGMPGGTEVRYHVNFTNQAALNDGKIAVTLPPQFRYVPGTGALTLDGAPLTVPAPTVEGETVTWDLGIPTLAPGRTITVDMATRPGLMTGLLNASAVVTGDAFSLNAATDTPISVTENFEGGDTESSAAAVQAGRMQFSHLGHAGDVDYYSIPAPPAGSYINAFLTCGTCDADLTVYHPASARQHNPLRPAVDAPELRPEIDHAPGLASSGEPLVPLALQDMPIIDRPVAGISANRGTASEAVQARAWDAPGSNYLIQVSSYNGSTSPEPYTLRITVTPALTAPPVGNARVFPHDADATLDSPPVPSSFVGTQTLVLANRNRLRRAYGDARADVALAALDRLANAPDLGVKVLFLDAFPEIPSAAHDAQPSNPELANDVVRAINARVDSLLGADRAGLRHIVLAGTDEIIPMARIPDLTTVANERDFSQELRALAASTGGNNALLGAAARGYITSDDPFCSFSPSPYLGSHLYIPDVACGRLVETPEDMATVIDQFLTPTQSGDAPGVLRPAKSLSVGADFMVNLAEELKSTMNSELTPGQVASLIGNSWTKANLEAAFPNAAPVPDIIGLQAHFNPEVLLPGDPSGGLFTTAAFGNSTPAQIAKRIVATMGCHSGFSISNFLSSSGSAPDWAETMLGKGVAAFVGNTSYGIGQADVVSFSAKIMGDFVDNIADMPLGIALTEAKRGYLGGLLPNVYDYKVMAQATFYGLPMFKVAGAGDGPPPGPAPRPTSVDPATGLTAADVNVSNPVGSNWRLVDTGHGKYWALNSAAFNIERDRPIVPRVIANVGQNGLEPRGAYLTALESIDQANFDPALATATVGGETTAEVQHGDTIFPTAIPSLLGNELSLSVAQFQSNGNGTRTGIDRRFPNVGARVLYALPGTPHFVPEFSSISALKNGPTGSFKVSVAAPGGSVQGVSVGYNDGTSQKWTFRELALAADGTWVGGFPISSSRIQYIVQARSNTGDIAYSTNKGDFFDFVTPDAGNADISAQVTPNESNGWYPNNATLILDGEGVETFTVSDNNGPASTWSAGQPIPITGSGVHTVHYVASPGGESGDVTVRIDDAKPTISGAPTSSPNAAGWHKSPVTVHFECADAHSGVASCEPDRTLSADGTDQSVTGTAVDHVGNTETATVGGINIDQTGPTVGGTPTTAPNANGWYTGPVTVHFTCSDERSGVATCPADQTVNADGANQSVTGTATDVAGNSTSFTVSGINIDTVAPTITATADRAPNAAGWYHGPVTVSFSCADPGGSGMATCPPARTISTQGANQTISGTAVDKAGHSTTASLTLSIDTGPPTIAGAKDRAANSFGWYNAPVTVTWTCADSLSGVASCSPPSTISTQGTGQSVTGAATDVAGNAAFATVSGINIDTTAPTISATPNDSTWRKGPVTVKFTCADDRSGVVACPADVVVSADGVTPVTGTVSDKAGNTSSVTVTVRIDKTLPTSSFNGSGTILVLPGGPIHGTATDNLSGVASVAVSFRNNLTGGTQTKQAAVSCAEPRLNCTWTVAGPSIIGFYTATVVATDRAGNVQNPGTVRSVQVIS